MNRRRLASVSRVMVLTSLTPYTTLLYQRNVSPASRTGDEMLAAICVEHTAFGQATNSLSLPMPCASICMQTAPRSVLYPVPGCKHRSAASMIVNINYENVTFR